MKHNFQIHHFDTLPSSNDDAKLHIQKYQDKDVIWCDTQTQGRGRFDRVWESKRDLTFSIVMHRVMSHHLIAPLAVVKALERFDKQAFIKWPNDILMQGKKVCGILVEHVYTGNECMGVVIGIGVNLDSIPIELQEKATNVLLEPLLLLNEILCQYEHLIRLDIKEILSMYQKVHYLQGRKILLDDVLWNVEGISEEGYLMIKNQDTLRTLKNEEVTLTHIY